MILPPAKKWTAGEDEDLALYWEAGCTANEIAAIMSPRSRNSVIGRAWRLGLPKRGCPLPKAFKCNRAAQAGLDAAFEEHMRLAA